MHSATQDAAKRDSNNHLIFSIQIIVLLLLCRIQVPPEASNDSTKLTY